ncbi:hypothetical protein VDGL01_05938 [Verticillium dahliae]
MPHRVAATRSQTDSTLLYRCGTQGVSRLANPHFNPSKRFENFKEHELLPRTETQEQEEPSCSTNSADENRGRVSVSQATIKQENDVWEITPDLVAIAVRSSANIIPKPIKPRGRPRASSTLNRGIRIEDFRLPDPPRIRTRSRPEALELLCRDGFDDMESVPTRKQLRLKRRKQLVIRGMGQLAITTAPRTTLARLKRRPRMPEIDPDLLPTIQEICEPRQGGISVEHPNVVNIINKDASITPGSDNPLKDSSTEKGPPSRQESTVFRSFRRSLPRRRSPLQFGRTLTGDLKMVRAFRYETPGHETEDDEEAMSLSDDESMSDSISQSSRDTDASEDGQSEAVDLASNLASTSKDQEETQLTIYNGDDDLVPSVQTRARDATGRVLALTDSQAFAQTASLDCTTAATHESITHSARRNARHSPDRNIKLFPERGGTVTESIRIPGRLTRSVSCKNTVRATKKSGGKFYGRRYHSEQRAGSMFHDVK